MPLEGSTNISLENNSSRKEDPRFSNLDPEKKEIIRKAAEQLNVRGYEEDLTILLPAVLEERGPKEGFGEVVGILGEANVFNEG